MEKTSQILIFRLSTQNIFIFCIFTCWSFPILGLLLSESFRIFKFLLLIKFTTTKLKNAEQQKIQRLRFSDKQHCVENHKHQKFLALNVYIIHINLSKNNALTEPIYLAWLNKATGFYMNQIILKMGEVLFGLLAPKILLKNI